MGRRKRKEGGEMKATNEARGRRRKLDVGLKLMNGERRGTWD